MWIMVGIFPLGATCGLWLILCHLDPHVDYGLYFSLRIHIQSIVNNLPFGSTGALWFIFCYLDPHEDFGPYNFGSNGTESKAMLI